MFRPQIVASHVFLVIGLMSLATAPASTLLAIPGRQAGHVQLIHLPPCPPPPRPSVEPSPMSPHQPPAPVPAPGPPPMRSNTAVKAPISIILAHTTPLTTLCSPPSGRLLSTTSERGTLIRVWDTSSGKLVRELRRGSDKAEIYGVAFRGDESEVCVWSDKGTVHVFKIGLPTADATRGAMRYVHDPLCPYLIGQIFETPFSFSVTATRHYPPCHRSSAFQSISHRNGPMHHTVSLDPLPIFLYHLLSTREVIIPRVWMRVKKRNVPWDGYKPPYASEHDGGGRILIRRLFRPYLLLPSKERVQARENTVYRT